MPNSQQQPDKTQVNLFIHDGKNANPTFSRQFLS